MKSPRHLSCLDCQRVYDVLMALQAKGPGRAIKRAEIAKRLNLPDRSLRAIVAAAGRFQLPIGSSSSGYFICQSREDAERAARECDSRIRELSKRAKAYRGLFPVTHEIEQRLF